MYLTSASQWNEKTPRKITEIRKEEQPRVSCILLFPGWHSVERKLTSYKRFLCWKVRMRWETSFSRAPFKDLLWSNSSQPPWSWDKQRMLGKGGSAAVTEKELGFPSVQLCRGPLELLPLWNQVQHSCLPLLADSVSFHTWVFVLHRCPPLESPSPACSLLPSVDLGTHGSKLQASMAGWVQDASAVNPSLPGTPFDISPSSCAFAPCYPDLTGLSSTCVITEIL